MSLVHEAQYSTDAECLMNGHFVLSLTTFNTGHKWHVGDRGTKPHTDPKLGALNAECG